MLSPAAAPGDRFDQQLVDHVAPADWRNPTPTGRYNLVVVGGGTAGLVTAMGAATLGGRVALIERHRLGGDCLNTGCVPSKAILRAARAAHDAAAAASFGVAQAAPPVVDFAAVMRRMRQLRAQIAEHDSARRFADAGVDVFLGQARFVARDAVEVDGSRLRFARAVVATGARPAVPPIPGLPASGYLTSDTIWQLDQLPDHLLVIGAGAIGCELAQAFRRFGSRVTVVSRDPQLLPRSDADAAEVLACQLRREGVELRLGAEVRQVQRNGSRLTVAYRCDGGDELRTGDALLVAVGRSPRVDQLGLDRAGIAVGPRGVEVDAHLRTSNRRVYAAGDVCGGPQLTHAADAMARIVIQNALFFGRAKASALIIPQVTYSDPEVAHVGLSEHQAQASGLPVVSYSVPLADIDRALLDGATAGFARLHIHRRSGRILGGTVVARHAGELIGELSLAMTADLRIATISATIHPYPTQSEVWKRLADQHQRSRLRPWVKRLLSWILARRR